MQYTIKDGQIIPARDMCNHYKRKYPFNRLLVRGAFEFELSELVRVTKAASAHGKRHGKRFRCYRLNDTHGQCIRIR
jgi:hypothetical protein